jgi:hypothetical protein
MNEYTFQRIKSITYLASEVTANNDDSVEIIAHLAAANKTYYGLQRHLKSKIRSICFKHHFNSEHHQIKHASLHRIQTRWNTDDARLGTYTFL